MASAEPSTEPSTEPSCEPSPDTTKYYTRAEVSKYNDCNETWIIIHNYVYNVTAFLAEHPGGEEVLLEQAGQDGTEAFEDVGHSSDARQMMEPYKIGKLVPEEQSVAKEKKKKDWPGGSGGSANSSGAWRSWLVPVALGVLATLVYRYFVTAH